MHSWLIAPRRTSLTHDALRFMIAFLVCLACLWSGMHCANAQAPSAPSGLTAVAGNQRVNLGWSAVSGAASYTILRGTASGGPYFTTVTSGLTTTNYANVGLTNGTTYYYVVTATNASGTSGNSSQTSATPGTALATPTNFAAIGQSGQITLSWTPVTGATGYNIYRWTGTNPQSYSPTYSNVTSNPYVDSGLTNGTLYYYAISAVGSSGAESVLSASVNAQPVTAPTGLTARAGNTQVTLSWSSSTGGARTNIYRGTTSGGEGATPIATISDHSLTYTDSGLTNGQAYYYQVSAANGSTGYGYGESTRSTEASATPMPPLPVAPTGLNALAGNHQVSLSWNSASYATSYNVKRSTVYGQGYTTISSPTGTTYTDTTATNGVTYYYIVTGVNVSGEGANSNQVDATPQASSTSASNGLTAIADSFTAQASPSSNYGYNATLYSGSPEGSRHISYFKFDLSGAGGSITSAHLNLTGSFNNSASPGVTSDSFSAYSILDNSWTELGITWANQPSLGSVLDTKSVSTGTATYSWDVTSFIKSQQASGVGQISLAVAQTTTPTVNTYATFFPREASASWPTLVVNVGGPIAPTLMATGGLKQVSLSWTAVPGAASYTVQRSTTSGGPYTAVANGTAITATTLTDSGLSDGTTYYYVVNASNGNGAGATSNEASATTTPIAPINLIATAVSDIQVNLSWSAVTGGSSYNIYRSTSSGSGYTQVSSGAIVGTTYVDKSTAGNTLYYYVVQAVNNGGVSANSNQASVMTPPAAPINLTAVPSGIGTQGASQVNLTWGASAGASVKYRVYRSNTSGGPYSLLTTSPTASLSYIDTQGLNNGSIYYYVVTASNSIGESSYSNEANALIQSTYLVLLVLSKNTNKGGDVGPNAIYGYVVLNAAAPTGGLSITLQSDNVAASVPQSISVPAGKNISGNFNIATIPVAVNTAVHIIASNDGNSATQQFTILCPQAIGITISPQSVIGGQSAVGTISIDGISPVGGLVISSLTSNLTSVQVPSSVTIPAGTTSATFNVITQPVDADVTAYISSGSFAETDFTVKALAINGLTLTPSSVITGGNVTGQVSLPIPARSGGFVVNLSSDRSCAIVSKNVTIPAGEASATFSISTNLIGTLSQNANITASSASGALTKSFEILPILQPLNLVATPISSSEIDLKWTLVDGASSYRIESSLNGVANWAIATSTVASYQSIGLLPGQKYYYRIVALGNNNSSEYSPIVGATTAASNVANLTAQAGDSQVSLIWATSLGAISYNVERSYASGGPYNVIASNITGLTYTDSGLINNITYYYIVVPIAGTTQGTYSNEAEATPNSGEGSYPAAGLSLGNDGKLYGTTEYGGAGYGTLFSIDPLGAFLNLYSFSALDAFGANADGANPSTQLTSGAGGYLYGGASNGGNMGFGSAFKIDSIGHLTSQPMVPMSHLLYTADGFLYGTTQSGGDNGTGAIFKMDSSGLVTTLYSFSAFDDFNTNVDGAMPMSGLVRGSDGNLYGVTSTGGLNGTGTIFKLDNNNQLTVLHSFAPFNVDDAYIDDGSVNPNDGNIDGTHPNELTLGGDGNLYGTTQTGGPNDNGIAFKVTLLGTYSVIHAFSSSDYSGINTDGINPCQLTLGSDSCLYGVATFGGLNGNGTLFKIDQNLAFTTICSFNTQGIMNPIGNLISLSPSWLYGVSLYGGENNQGCVFRIDQIGNSNILKSF